MRYRYDRDICFVSLCCIVVTHGAEPAGPIKVEVILAMTWLDAGSLVNWSGRRAEKSWSGKAALRVETRRKWTFLHVRSALSSISSNVPAHLDSSLSSLPKHEERPASLISGEKDILTSALFRKSHTHSSIPSCSLWYASSISLYIFFSLPMGLTEYASNRTLTLYSGVGMSDSEWDSCSRVGLSRYFMMTTIGWMMTTND